MIALVIVAVAFTILVMIYGVKNFPVDEETREFLKPVLSWFLIGLLVFFLIHLMGGGVE